MEPDVRAYVITFVGKDGQTAKVVFDRYQGHAGLSPQQATSNALGAVIEEYGPDWIDSYRLVKIETRKPRY